MNLFENEEILNSEATDIGELLPLAPNVEQRCVGLMLADRSGSMANDPIREVNNGLIAMNQAMRDDPIAGNRVDCNLVSFGSDVTVEYQGLLPKDVTPPELRASGTTRMGAAIHTSLDIIEKQVEYYKSLAIPQNIPIAILLTDGLPTDSIDSARERIHQMEQRGKLHFFAIGVNGADMATLDSLSSTKNALRLDPNKFSEFFIWATMCFSAGSSPTPGNNAQLPPIGWAQI